VPRQNRVTPFGDIIATESRGLLFGNRGVLHDDEGRLVRAWQVCRWIACLLEFKSRRRPLMRPGRFTELFFLDEATALAAGHRPCAECRRADFLRFREAWMGLHPDGSHRVDDIDRVMQAERIDTRGSKRLYQVRLEDLPDGAMVAHGDQAWLVLGEELLPWSPSGYGGERKARGRGTVMLLTPPSIVGILRSGYEPLIHPTARDR